MDERLIRAMLEVDERHWWYRGRRAIIAGELDRLALRPGARALDAGCGSGRMLLELARYGEVSGIELNDQAVAAARARGPFDVRAGRVEELPWDAGEFDLITCLDVVEHLRDDVGGLAELRRVSAPGGWLVVTVPAYQALWSQHDVANHHQRRYSRRAFAAAAAAAGWDAIRVTSFNSLLLPVAAAWRLALKRGSSTPGESTDLKVPPGWLNRTLERPLRVEARWLAAGRTLPAGLSLMAILRNPIAGADRSPPARVRHAGSVGR
jgi:SAM-dependent methyltransferase